MEEPTQELDENATSAALQNIFSSVSVPTLSEEVLGDGPKKIADLSADVPPPPAAPVDAPPVDTAAVDATETAPPPKPRVPLKARTSHGVNYTAAFLLYAKGVPLKQIADEFDMNYGKLLQRSVEEDWEILVRKHSSSIVAPPPKPENMQLAAADQQRKMQRILDNREKNFQAASSLRENVEKVIATYAAENQFLVPGDILTLAKTLKLTTEISMLALGDELIMKAGGDGKPQNNGNGQRPIMIVLPSVLAAGKQLRPAERAVAAIPPPAGDEEDADAVLEISVTGPKLAEAAPTPTKRGSSINFEQLGKNTAPRT